MSDSPNPAPVRFCSACGAPLQPGTAFCGHCGARSTAPAPQYAYSPAWPTAQPPYGSPASRAAGFPLKWIGLSIGVVVLIVVAILVINAVGGAGGGPTKEDIARNANFFSGNVDDLEILRMEKCKLTDLDKSRGYTQKWIVEYQNKSSSYHLVSSDAWAFDGYEWNDYFAAESKTGCPN